MKREIQIQRAAALIAAGELSVEQIAARLNVSRRQLDRWQGLPHFKTLVEAEAAIVQEAIRDEGISSRQNRVDALNNRWRRMQQVIDERAADPIMSDVPGGTTGLLVRSYKMIGSGRDASTVEEYSVDIGLLKEMRAHEQQAAQELGQWTEKQEHSGTIQTGGPDLSKLSDEELRAYRELLAKATNPR